MIVVIDGPAGSGKSSTARAIADKLQIQFLDSGALYRVATLLYLNEMKNYSLFLEHLKESEISFYFKAKKFHVSLNNCDVSDEIRTMEVSKHVSKIASDPEVRSYINDLMREVVKHDIYIADGRDLGTAVFPDAELKFYMVADLDTRARRRLDELNSNPRSGSLELEEVKINLAERDYKDSSREADPLAKADDAIMVDTSELSFNEQVTMISEKIEKLIHSQQNKP